MKGLLTLILVALLSSAVFSEAFVAPREGQQNLTGAGRQSPQAPNLPNIAQPNLTSGRPDIQPDNQGANAGPKQDVPVGLPPHEYARKGAAAEVLRARYRYLECQIDFSFRMLSEIAASSPEARTLQLHIQRMQQSRDAIRLAAELGEEQDFSSALRQARQTVQEANREVAMVAAQIGKEKTSQLRQKYVELKQQMAECKNEAMMALGQRKLQQYAEAQGQETAPRRVVENIERAIAAGNPEMLKEALNTKCLGGVCTSKEKYYENAKEQASRLQTILNKVKANADSPLLEKAQMKINEANAITAKLSTSYDEEAANKIRSNLAEAAALIKQAAQEIQWAR
ncbi:MAG: hypothetical protein QXT25_04395 [Candidatus Anstonellaceae archaeon]